MESHRQHKLFVVICDREKAHPVTAIDCERCSSGSVIDGRSRVVCGGVTKFFMTPCGFDMRSAATVEECDKCKSGEICEDRIRVYCSRF